LERGCPSTRQARRSDTPNASRRCRASRRRWAAVTTFFGRLLEQFLVQGQLGDEALEPGVLGLQLLEALGIVLLGAAVLVAPAVQGQLADAGILADLGNAEPLGQFGLSLAQLGDDLLSSVSLPG
jgi:hypothetical protein